MGRQMSDRQSAGLRDRDGELLFEGDIVVIKESVDRGDGKFDDGLCLVVFDTDCQAFHFMGDLDELLSAWTQDSLVAHDIVLVGNIFETPELMEGIDRGGNRPYFRDEMMIER